MLFTVFVERLLLSAPLVTTSENKYAIAIQFLDYPLIVVRRSSAGDAAADVQQDIVLFKRGTAAVLDAEECELDFLVSHVSGLQYNAIPLQHTYAACLEAVYSMQVLSALLELFPMHATISHCLLHNRFPRQHFFWMSIHSRSSLHLLQQGQSPCRRWHATPCQASHSSSKHCTAKQWC